MRSVFFAVIFAMLPMAAQAYVGPGAGLGAIAVTLAIVLGLILLIVGFLWYPLKRLLGRKKADVSNTAATDTDK